MLGKAAYLAGAAAGALALSQSAQASETIAYTYDALGRLVAVSSSGGPNNGLNVSTCYDRAGNRAVYAVATGSPPAACPPPPPPPNQPPVAVADTDSATKCAVRSVQVTANDSDPDANYPLTVTAVNQPWAQVGGGGFVEFEAPSVNGTYVIAYTVADSLGATAGSTLTVTVSGGPGSC
jgi:YD repeat-containing protein